MRDVLSKGGNMTERQWKSKIKAACISAGTYQECFDSVIASLAAILARRDETERYYQEQGGEPLVTYTNKNGAQNQIKNPALVMWHELDKTALAYWRELGLTPAELKRINEQAMKPAKRSALSQALKEIGEEN